MTSSSGNGLAHRESTRSDAGALKDDGGGHHHDASSKGSSLSWPWGGALTISISVTILASAASYAYVWYQRRDNARQRPKLSLPSILKINGNGHAGSHDRSKEEQEFAIVAGRVRNLRNVPTKERLILYALYKQATVGDAPPIYESKKHGVNGGAAFVTAMQEHAKWDAWNRLRGMNQARAVHMYVELANQLLPASSAGSTTAESTQADEGDDNGDADDVVASSGAFGPPKVSQLVELEDDDDESENDDNNKGDESNPTLHHCRKLLSAASTNDLEMLKKLLAENPALVNVADGSGQTALHMSSDRGHVTAVELLIDEFGANVVASDDDGISVLQAAVIAGHVDVCRALLQRGADPDQPDHDGDTPRSCADDDGSTEMRDLFGEC